LLFGDTIILQVWVVTLHNLFLYSDPPLLCHPPSCWLRLFFPYKYCNVFKPSHLSYLSAYEDGTDRVFRNVGIKNSDAGELPRRKHTTGVYLVTWLYDSGNLYETVLGSQIVLRVRKVITGAETNILFFII